MGADPISPPSGTGDGPTGLVQAPMSAATYFALTGRTPTHAYTCQEGSGNLIDQIGAVNLVVAGAPAYGVSVAGWARKGVGFNETLNQRFSVSSGTGPNPTLTPIAMLCYFTARTVSAMRGIMMVSDAGASARSNVGMGATGILRTQCGAVTNDGVPDYRDSAVHALLLTYDQGGSTTNRYTDLERDDGTFAAGVIDGIKGLGGVNGNNSHVGEVLAYWIFDGADALFSAAQAKTHLQLLGWTIPWT